jgi:hypothetical protein
MGSHRYKKRSEGGETNESREAEITHDEKALPIIQENQPHDNNVDITPNNEIRYDRPSSPTNNQSSFQFPNGFSLKPYIPVPLSGCVHLTL